MHGSRNFFPGGGGSDGYLCLPGGSEAYFWQFYNVIFKYLNFESGGGELDPSDPPLDPCTHLQTDNNNEQTWTTP